MFNDLVLIACSAVLFLTAVLVLKTCAAFEISTRSASAGLFAVAAIWCLKRAVVGPPASLAELALPAGVCIWLLGALWRRRGQPMRRASDWNEGHEVAAAAGAIDRAPWLPPRG